MPNSRFHTPALYPNESNAWVKLGIDPRRFFRLDGTMDDAFFAVPSVANATLSTPAPLPAPAPCAGAAPLFINITINRA
ncbi:MAG: hypothetical protein M3Y54_21580 [Bacteroidota bacterium]|nr:hypothetical protein [Bacteroidota bacterium]